MSRLSHYVSCCPPPTHVHLPLGTSPPPPPSRDPALREAATTLFATLSEAHDVLSDPDRRRLYDIVGKAGLNAGTDLSTFDGETLRQKWEEIRAAQEKRRGEASASTFKIVNTMNVDARQFLADIRRVVRVSFPVPPRPPTDHHDRDDLVVSRGTVLTNSSSTAASPRSFAPSPSLPSSSSLSPLPPLATRLATITPPQVKGVVVSTSASTPLRPGLTVGLQGSVATQRKLLRLGQTGTGVALDAGEGTLSGSVDWELTPVDHLQSSVSFGMASSTWALWLSRNFTSHDQILVQMQVERAAISPREVGYGIGFGLHAHRTFSTHPSTNTGLFSWNVGPVPGLGLTLQHKRPTQGPDLPGRSATVKIDASLVQSTIATQLGWALPNVGTFGVRAKCPFPGSPGGPELEITVSKKWDDQRATNASVAWLAGSVVGKTTHVHAGHRVDVPVVWFGGSPWGAVLGALETSEDAEDAAAAAAATARAMDVAWASLAAVSFPLVAAAVYVGIVRPVRCLWATWSGAAQRSQHREATQRAAHQVGAVARVLAPLATTKTKAAIHGNGLAVLYGWYGPTELAEEAVRKGPHEVVGEGGGDGGRNPVEMEHPTTTANPDMTASAHRVAGLDVTAALQWHVARVASGGESEASGREGGGGGGSNSSSRGGDSTPMKATVPRSRKDKMWGFADPCPWREEETGRALVVWYLSRGRAHVAVLEDEGSQEHQRPARHTEVLLPQSVHVLALTDPRQARMEGLRRRVLDDLPRG